MNKKPYVNPLFRTCILHKIAYLTKLISAGDKTYFIPEPPDEEKVIAARRKREYDKMMWAVFKEISFYMFFLVLICFIAWGTKDDSSKYRHVLSVVV